MVKRKDPLFLSTDGRVTPEPWLEQLKKDRQSKDWQGIMQAATLAKMVGENHPAFGGLSCQHQGLIIADILSDLMLDAETISAALIYPCVQYGALKIEDVSEQLGKNIAKLTSGVEKMNAVESFHHLEDEPSQHKNKIENIRKMLLAMVEDVRVVLIKIAEHLSLLRAAENLRPKEQRQLAKQAQEIYAPLSNRLGLSSLKWEIEDLAFRYFHSEEYHAIAKQLHEKRIDREQYIAHIIEVIENALRAEGIHHFAITGRAKHIYSIYRKMHRKNIPFEKVYDIFAVRILVDSIEQCYTALGIVHGNWLRIQEEFDDYIENPKPNGYQSIHTAIRDPAHDNKVFEVQIRTFKMHSDAELGVAAHWMYKEGARERTSHENKIDWLRQVLDWHKELAHSPDTVQEIKSEIIEDRVYIFTPKGEVLDLPIDSTPLDFAYHIHSEIGHRCRGAKVNGVMVPLTHRLKTGEQVEIITGKHAGPSRDWLNTNLGYIHTPRARAKIHHYFRELDYDKNVDAGKAIFERELKRLNLASINISELAEQLHVDSDSAFFAGLGNGDIKISQVLQLIQKKEPGSSKTQENFSTLDLSKSHSHHDIRVAGVGGLLTRMARCCSPVPGEPIVGYVTLGQGVSVHRQSCPNLLSASNRHHERLIDVHWQTSIQQTYPVNLEIHVHDRHGLIKDITTILSNEKVNIHSLQTLPNKDQDQLSIHLTIDVVSLEQLSKILDKIQQVPNVLQAFRLKA